MTQFKYKYLKINGMLISRGIGARSQRAKRQVFLFIPKVNVFFFSIMGIFHKTLNLALEVLDQSQGSLDYYLS